jgi:hypothetical protein
MPVNKGNKQTARSTQSLLPIDSIQDNVVVMRDGSLRAVLMASSLNFDLKSTNEQDAIIYAYQHFLNSLDFPIQIQVSSRVLNINNYIDYLEEVKQLQQNELLRMQTEEYVYFIQELISTANIVNKTFYIVVPFHPLDAQKKSLINEFLGGGNESIKYSKEQFEKYKTQLWQRVNGVMYGIRRTGVYTTPLNTQELIELYYSLYNPDSSSNTLHDVNDLDIN